MEQLKIKNKLYQRGSMTLELAMIFPLMFSLLLLIFYTLMVAYDKAAAQAILDSQVSQAGAIWGQIQDSGDYEQLSESDEEPPLSASPLYWRIGIVGSQAEKDQQIADYVTGQLKNKLLLTPKEVNVQINYVNYFLSQKIEMTAELLYDNPLSGLLNTGDYGVIVSAQASVKDEAERIRNIDFAGDLIDEFQVTADLKDQYFNAIQKGKDWIGNFFQ